MSNMVKERGNDKFINKDDQENEAIHKNQCLYEQSISS